MKLLKSIILYVLINSTISASAQNVSINILTQNSGVANLSGTVYLEVTICNTDVTENVPSYTLRPRISVPLSICSIPASGHTLPAGWNILTNTGSIITLSNGTDEVPANECRTLLISIQGNAVGGPLTISGTLLFANGIAPGNIGSSALPGDDPSDNSSQSTIQVINPVPVTLTDFSAKLVNCEPSLKWVTETEINSDRFEIERGNITNTNWSTIGVVAAMGYSNNKTEYKFTDRNNSTAEKILYRLKMIDKDGHYKYSKILPVFINCKTTNVYVYPNPVQDGKLYVSLTGAAGLVDASLLSMSGQVLLKAKMNNGTNSLNVSTIANGTYVLNIQDANGVNKKEKVIIQH